MISFFLLSLTTSPHTHSPHLILIERGGCEDLADVSLHVIPHILTKPPQFLHNVHFSLPHSLSPLLVSIFSPLLQVVLDVPVRNDPVAEEESGGTIEEIGSIRISCLLKFQKRIPSHQISHACEDVCEAWHIHTLREGRQQQTEVLHGPLLQLAIRSIRKQRVVREKVGGKGERKRKRERERGRENLGLCPFARSSICTIWAKITSCVWLWWNMRWV